MYDKKQAVIFPMTSPFCEIKDCGLCPYLFETHQRELLVGRIWKKQGVRMMGFWISVKMIFFLSGSSSDEANADDEWTYKSTREEASSTSEKSASGMSSDERNQRRISARALMPAPRHQVQYVLNQDSVLHQAKVHQNMLKCLHPAIHRVAEVK
ncbi:hypothetical protein ABKV19_009348 [Rosa sericea]